MRVPYEIPRDTFISVIEVVPDNKKVVHHINAQLLSYEYDKRKDVMKGMLWWILMNTQQSWKLINSWIYLTMMVVFPMMTTSVTNFLPGVTPPIYPNGIGGFKMKRKGALFLKDMHYGPSRLDTTDQTAFNVFFAPHAPKRPTKEFQMGTFGVSPIEPS